MLRSFDKKFLFGSTVIAGFAAMMAVSPAYAQSGQTGVTPTPTDRPQPTPGVVQPNSDDQAGAEDQATAGGEDPGEVEAVVVTGSRIRRDPTNAPTPLIQIGREEVIESGEPNIVDYLADIPALQNSVVPEDTTGGGLGDGGLSLLNLRNLGTARTLVLVDGRRHVGSSPFTPTSVDVDTIPRLLIQNVEVITGGASAVYGADAVAGVVNFILRDDFEGVEVDAALAMVNEDGQLNRRLSAIAGRNFLNDRLNVYVTAEYEQSDEVTQADIDIFNSGRALFQNDLDPNPATPDGVADVLPGTGFGSLNRPVGGILTLAGATRPSPSSDPDIPFAACPTTFFSGNCFIIDPGRSFVFNEQGTARDVNFGTFRQPAGLIRNLVVGSPDALPLSQFQASRLPYSENKRFQTGFNFDVFDGLTAFGNVKYVEEQNIDNFQPAFFNIGLTPAQNGRQARIGNLFNFEIGTDNAFLDPALRQRIETNRRPVFNAAGTQTGIILDPRAQFINFTPELGFRPQDNTRELFRYVLGVRGDRDRLLGFINNFAYEVGYTFGQVEDVNEESETVDSERYAFAVDAVRNASGQVVCRVQQLAAAGTPIRRNSGGTYAATDEAVAGCVPIRLFGPNGVSEAARDYVLTSQNTTNKIQQEDVLAFASGELFDFFGAGPVGVAVGAEYRKETLSGEFNSPNENGDFLLFANVLSDVPEVSFEVKEYFTEVRVPLLRDRTFAESLELTGQFRRSEYSRTGTSDTYGFNLTWRPTKDILFRGTKGVAIREPNLFELFDPQSQTFAQLADPCDANNIRNTADPRIRANRIRNCSAFGVPADFVDPAPGTSNAGRSGGNPDLQQEESDSFTIGTVITPRFARGLSVVVDYFDIDVENAIAFLGAQQIVEQCFSLDVPNPLACNTISRDPNNFEITDFLSSPLNFAGLRARGIDFGGRYRLDSVDFFDRDMGRLDFSLRGSYLIRRQNFTNPTDPNSATEVDATIGNPRVRVLFGTTYTLNRLGVTWEVDYQTSQEILDNSALVNDADNRPPELLNTGAFTQHDFLLRYDVTDSVRLRAGVINAFDEEPSIQAQGDPAADIFDFFGRRFYVGLNVKFGAAANRRR